MLPDIAAATVSVEKVCWAQTLEFGDEILRADLNADNAETILAWPEVAGPAVVGRAVPWDLDALRQVRG